MAASGGNVEIRQVNKLKGRGLFALHNIDKGEVILEETPVVSSQFLWNSLYKYKACDYCMKSLETAEEMSQRLCANPSVVLPFPECCKVQKDHHVTCSHCQELFCSPGCRDVAWNQYHQTLCLGQSAEDPDHPLAKLQDTWRNIHYPPETASIMLIAKIIATVKQAKDKDLILAAFSQFCKATINEEEEIAHKLLGKEFQEQLELLRQMITEALYDENLQQWFTQEGFRSLFAMIGTNGQGIGTSSLSTWVHNSDSLELPENERKNLDAFIDQLYVDIEKESGTFLNCEGSGLYVLQSACNHSCVPNAEIQFNNNDSTLSLVALEDIREQEEIHICYLEECQRERSRHARQKILRENYLFNCECANCLSQADDPDVTSSEDEEEDVAEMDQ